MKIDLSGAELFFRYLAGRARAEEVLEHPAYKIVQAHARLLSNNITPEDIHLDLRGEPSTFYGLAHVRERLPQIETLINAISVNEHDWLADASSALLHLAPGQDLDRITIYPIIGYDMGIGLQETVCMNLNTDSYLASPREFFYFMIHEAFHCIYERSHFIPAFSQVITARQWLSYFNMWVHNEGYATYAPLSLREERGDLHDAFGDYAALRDAKQVQANITEFKDTVAVISEGLPAGRNEYLELLFGSRRLTYRVGCGLIMRVGRDYGYRAVQEGVNLTGDGFLDLYGKLLDDTLQPST
jgi:hypothetical protein